MKIQAILFLICKRVQAFAVEVVLSFSNSPVSFHNGCTRDVSLDPTLCFDHDASHIKNRYIFCVIFFYVVCLIMYNKFIAWNNPG